YTPPVAKSRVLIDSSTTVLSTLSLHDALPILLVVAFGQHRVEGSDRAAAVQAVAGALHQLRQAREHRRRIALGRGRFAQGQRHLDRKSTRLNSSHVKISYAVFCLKKKKQNKHR